MIRQSRALGLALVLFSSIVMAAIPTAARLALDSGSNTLTVVALRSVFAVVTVLACLAVMRSPLRIGLVGKRAAIWSGLAYAVTSFVLVGAVARLPVSLAIILFFLHPIFLALYGHFTGRHSLTALRLGMAIVVFVGLALTIGPDFSTFDPLGLLYGFASAVAVCVMIVLNDRAQGDTSNVVVNLFMTTISALVFVAITTSVQQWALPGSPIGWFGLIGAGVGLGIGLLAFFAAFAHIGSVRTTMISSVEPVLGVVVAVMVFGGSFSNEQWIGVAMVLSGLVLFEVTDRPDDLVQPPAQTTNRHRDYTADG